MSTLRTKETHEKYQQVKSKSAPGGPCFLCTREGHKKFSHWKIMKNDFPYDRIAEVHDTIAPLRHVTEHELTGEEWGEFQKIKKEYIAGNYQFVMEAMGKEKSIPDHFHVHLIVVKDE